MRELCLMSRLGIASVEGAVSSVARHGERHKAPHAGHAVGSRNLLRGQAARKHSLERAFVKELRGTLVPPMAPQSAVVGAVQTARRSWLASSTSTSAVGLMKNFRVELLTEGGLPDPGRVEEMSGLLRAVSNPRIQLNFERSRRSRAVYLIQSQVVMNAQSGANSAIGNPALPVAVWLH